VAPGPLNSNNAVKATVSLVKPISNGLTYNFTFTFEKAGRPTCRCRFRPVGATAGLTGPVAYRDLSHSPITSWRGKSRSQYRCSECRHVTANGWAAAWNVHLGTVDEVAVLSAVGASGRRAVNSASPPVPISSIEPNVSRHRATGVANSTGARRRCGPWLGDAVGG